MDSVDNFAPPRSVGERLMVAGGVLAIGLVLQIVCTVIYRYWFHPLAKYPGPFINAVSDLPGVVWTLRGRLPMETRKLHDKYGSVIRLSPNELSFNTLGGWRDIYGHRSGRKDLSKHSIHVGAVDPMPGVQTISMADHDNHARQRKALSHGFSKKALWEQEKIIQEFVTKLMGNIHRFAEKGEAFDIVKWFNFVTFDVIGDLSFGESFGCLERGDFHFWITLIFDAVKAGAIEQASRRFATAGSPTQKLLQKLAQGSLAKRRADHLTYSRTKVMRYDSRAKDSDRKDFIHYILKQSEHYDLSQGEVIVNAALFIVAGSETTASSLASLMNNLLRHPRVYAKLKEEIRSTFQSEDDITLEVAHELPYLSACLEENLRIFPPAPIGFLREIQKGGDVIDGHHIPGGTAVSVSSWCAHHNPENFKDPDLFVPERWLDDPKYKGDEKLATRPFSLGPRGCIGKDLSYVEMRLVVCRLLWNFEITNADSAIEWEAEDNMKHMKAYSTWQKPGLNVGPSKHGRPRSDSEEATGSRLDKIESTLETIASLLEQKTATPASHNSEISTTSPASTSGTKRSPIIPRMPNLFSFRGPDPWYYDCTEDFFINQLDCMPDMRHIHQMPAVDLSRPHLWRLQQSFVENVLKWLPLFDQGTTLKHLQAAQLSKYDQDSPSICLVYLINAIGSLTLDNRLYTEALEELPGFSYYLRAYHIMQNFPLFTKDLCILQCRTLTAMYFLYAMRPLESWRAICQVSQNCILHLKAGIVDREPPSYRDAFERIFWISYVIDNELEVCLELPPSGLKHYETKVPLPSSHYEEEGMYCLLAISSLRKLMVEVVKAVGMKGSAVATYAPVVVMELRNQIDNWYRHLPSSLRFPLDRSLLFDKRRAYLRCQYHALIVVVFWPFVPRSKEPPYNGRYYIDEESQRIIQGSKECLTACRDFLKGTDEILTQKTLGSHVIVRSYFTMTMVLLLTFTGADSSDPSVMEDRSLLEYAMDNLSHWKVVPFLRRPLAELERIAQLKGLSIPIPLGETSLLPPSCALSENSLGP
ncbi:hypothetical protein FE257_005034 [Aspergillus nanangensis]|uniref:Xylanolytic transcriptional activator regulatory domain-containing protein n=1 Tax=Aspergillus nanangensis TaxID=2582783 RepID=A0AAD4CRI4_ASPNN|nr:hypothetical protein FE257_005034 [Aspergillus nanangensis]